MFLPSSRLFFAHTLFSGISFVCVHWLLLLCQWSLPQSASEDLALCFQLSKETKLFLLEDTKHRPNRQKPSLIQWDFLSRSHMQKRGSQRNCNVIKGKTWKATVLKHPILIITQNRGGSPQLPTGIWAHFCKVELTATPVGSTHPTEILWGICHH